MTTESVIKKKRAIRDKIKTLRSRLSKEEVSIRSVQIRRLFFNLPEFLNAKTISFYVAKGNEVQTEYMIKNSLKLNKRVLVPITNKVSGKLIFSELRDYDAELEPGAFGVFEPKPAYRKETPPTETDLIVVPGVAFDTKGHRLGYGKGYYDRFLREVSSLKANVQFIGLAYEFQVLREIPYSCNDISVHKIVTEKRIIVPKSPFAKTARRSE